MVTPRHTTQTQLITWKVCHSLVYLYHGEAFTHHHTGDEERQNAPTLLGQKDLSSHKEPVAKNTKLSAISRHSITTWKGTMGPTDVTQADFNHYVRFIEKHKRMFF